MTKLIVDGAEIDVPADYTLLQACEAGGAEIPRFCFHERLSIAGNCRMCLIEVKGNPKPQASCAMAVRDLRPGPNGEPPVLNTRTPMVKKAREGVMEFLLINHPLDCPICDQGGECDLQDQAMAYGVDSSRFHENKRAVEDKYLGPLVKTSMNRCIHCTRCVRFITEVAGVADLGAIGRGEDMEITTYLEHAMRSELQANVVDLCPVGALTAKPWALQYRPWEFTKTESIDVMDAVGCAIRVDSRGREVMRILPRVNEDVNEEWISDKTRHVVDGLRTQRVDRPYVRGADGKLQPASWQEALAAVASKLMNAKPERIGAIAGELASVEEMFALKLLLESLGTANIDAREDGSSLHPRYGRASYLFNATIAGIEEADLILLVGVNPRLDAAVLNARLRKRWRMGNIRIGLIGEKADLTYPYEYLGAGAQTLSSIMGGEGGFGAALRAANKPMVVVGQGALSREGGISALSMIARASGNSRLLSQGWNGLCVLHAAASRVGALDIGFVPAKGGMDARAMAKPGALDVIYLLGADEIDVAPGAFVIYQGTHGDRGAHRADVILPGAAYTEKSGTFVNTEGRVQMVARAIFPPGEARDDWAIVRALSGALGKPLPFDSLAALRKMLYAAHAHLSDIGRIAPADGAAAVEALSRIDEAPSAPTFGAPERDYYLTNPIARASSVMAQCSKLARGETRIAAE
jgi:NADH-quinone oxidoreductase subunit G